MAWKPILNSQELGLGWGRQGRAVHGRVEVGGRELGVILA